MPPPPPNPIKLLLDFDSTLTHHDTTPLLATHVGYAPKNNPTPTTKNLPPWSHFFDAYVDHKQSIDEVYSTLKSSSALADVIRYQNYLRPVEEASWQRVMGAGVFEGVGVDDLKKGAWTAVESGDVGLRSGALELLRFSISGDQAGSSGSALRPAIVSVNWSAEWIRQVIDASSDGNSDALDEINVQANELPSLGGTWPNICTSEQKLQARRECCKGLSNDVVKVYVGDSMTDIECLLTADVGIMIRDEPMRGGQQELADVLEKGGRPVVSMFEAPTNFTAKGDLLFWAKDLPQICDWLYDYTTAHKGP